jgi:hypothetical protein
MDVKVLNVSLDITASGADALQDAINTSISGLGTGEWIVTYAEKRPSSANRLSYMIWMQDYSHLVTDVGTTMAGVEGPLASGIEAAIATIS